MGHAMEEVEGKGYWYRAHFLYIRWPRNKFHLQLHFPLLYHATVSLSSGQLCYLFSPSSCWERGLWDSSLTPKAEVETLPWGNLWGYSSAKAKCRAFLPVSNTTSAVRADCRSPCFCKWDPTKQGSWINLASFKAGGMPTLYKEAKFGAPEVMLLEFAC